MLDLHGYVDPDADRGDHQAAQPEHRVRHVAEVEPAADRLQRGGAGRDRPGGHAADQRAGARRPTRPAPDGICDDGSTPGPDVAEGWDDWGPFYAPMYHQHIGLDSSTVEMCTERRRIVRRPRAARARSRASSRSRRSSTSSRTARRCSRTSSRSTAAVTSTPRGPACCPEPFKPEFHNWMLDYPQAYVIPVGKGQRSDAEANRLVEWLLFNDIEVDELERDYRVGVADVRGGLVRRLDGPAAARPGRHRAEPRRRHLAAHPAAVRAAGGVEPRLPVGRRHGDDPRRRAVLAADRRDPPAEPPQGLGARAARPTGYTLADRLADRGARAQRLVARRRDGVDRARGVQRRPGRHGGVRHRQGDEAGARGRGARLRARLRQARLRRAARRSSRSSACRGSAC